MGRLCGGGDGGGGGGGGGWEGREIVLGREGMNHKNCWDVSEALKFVEAWTLIPLIRETVKCR